MLGQVAHAYWNIQDRGLFIYLFLQQNEKRHWKGQGEHHEQTQNLQDGLYDFKEHGHIQAQVLKRLYDKD